MNALELVAGAARAAEYAGVGVLIIGALLSAMLFFVRLGRRERFADAYQGFRADLARGILLGLELLVIGDIIFTVAVEPTLQSVVVLAIIVAIRTFLSFSLEVEVNGHWPWQHPSRPPAD
ncbi:MAG TPA: DUF1622 domain-containing protein [Usitatibacter sp.]|nr:DUF1622 domain-containing protein [Usitatibacter sp.]